MSDDPVDPSQGERRRADLMAMSSPASSAVASVAPQNSAPPQVVLLCGVRSWFCALPVAYVAETMRPLPLQPLAGAPSFVRGLSIIRGMPTPVVDAGTLLGAGDEPRSSRLVILRVDGRSVALAVEGVLDVRAIPSESLRELPPLLRDASREAVSAVGALDAALLMVLRAGHLVPESFWKAIPTVGGVR